MKKGFLKNFSKFTGKQLYQGFFFSSAYLSPSPNLKIREACNFIQKRGYAQVFSCEFCKIFKNTFFTKHLRAALSALKNLRSGKVLRNIVYVTFFNDNAVLLLSIEW